MARLETQSLITAIVCSEGRDAAPAMLRIVRHLASQGVRCTGFIQRDVLRPDQCRCDMLLEDLSTGEAIEISEHRGREARGCRLDVDAFLRATMATKTALQTDPDLLVVNKFGKTEAEGGGFRPIIAEAVERGIPLLIAVPWRNIEAWRVYSGDLCREVHLEDIEQAHGLADLEGFGLSTHTVGGSLVTAIDEAQCSVRAEMGCQNGSRPGEVRNSLTAS